ncbi:MAG: hypothetical protein R2705_00775 [Ilumatobacteraceae bacterium]
MNAIDRWNELSKGRRTLLLAGVGVVLLALTRVVTGADDLTSSGTVGTTLRLTIPILLAGMAGLWAERVGIVNIGIEGMMIMGTWFGAYGAWQWGAWAGLILAIVGGMLGGLIHAVATVTFNVDHIISGVAINLFALGAMRYLSELVFVGESGGGISQSPQQRSGIPTVDVRSWRAGTSDPGSRPTCSAGSSGSGGSSSPTSPGCCAACSTTCRWPR